MDITGVVELANYLKGVDVIVIPVGVIRKSGMTCDDLFNINVDISRDLVFVVADNCPRFLFILSVIH